MANYYKHDIPVQEISVENIGHNLRIILNDIFFIRNLNVTKPIQYTSQLYDIVYTCSDNAMIMGAIETSIAAFQRYIVKEKKTSGTMVVGFYRLLKKEKSIFGIKLNTHIEKIYWEKWNIPYIIINSKKIRDRVSVFARQKKHLTDIRTFISMESMKNHEIIPDTIDIFSKRKKNRITYPIPEDMVIIDFDEKPSHDFNISFTFSDNDNTIMDQIENIIINPPDLST